MSRPWNEATPCPHLEPDVAGQFNTFDSWVDHASHALTGVMSSVNRPLPAMCIDNLGRRCHCGADFMRARDENTFPVRYFWNFKNALAEKVQTK